jgi:hypothetical protein
LLAGLLFAVFVVLFADILVVSAADPLPTSPGARGAAILGCSSAIGDPRGDPPRTPQHNTSSHQVKTNPKNVNRR